MKKLQYIIVFMFAVQQMVAQYLVVGKDSISLEDFKKENLYGLQNSGIQKTIESKEDFLLLQQFAAEKKADTTKSFAMRLDHREDELRKQFFYPKPIIDEVLKYYLNASQTERNTLIFMVQKSPDDKTDYKKVYDEVKSGKMTMEAAVEKYTKNKAKPFYVKPGVLDNKLYGELQTIPVGGYTSLTNTSTYVYFAKLMSTRPSLGYMVFGAISYPNDAKAEATKTKIYNDLKGGKKFYEVTKAYGTTDNEKNNGGAVMGSPTLPDEVYNALKGHNAGYYTAEPIVLDGRYYIFNIYSLEPYKLNEKNEEFFKKEMMSSQYGTIVTEKLLNSLRSTPKFKSFPDFQKLKKSYQEYSNFKDGNAVLYQYLGYKKTVADFKKELSETIKELDKVPADEWADTLEMKQKQDVLNFYSEDFTNQKEIKKQLDDYKGNLYSEYIFSEYLKKEIDNNPKLLTDYYNAHKDKYMWEKRAQGRVAILTENSMQPEIEKQMKSPENWEKLKKKYYEKLNDQKQILVNFEDGKMVESADVFQKNNVPFKKGIYSTKMNDRVVVVAIDDILPPTQMTEEEAKEFLKDAVTEQILEQTIATQRAKTKIIVDPAFMSDLEKNFKK